VWLLQLPYFAAPAIGGANRPSSTAALELPLIACRPGSEDTLFFFTTLSEISHEAGRVSPTIATRMKQALSAPPSPPGRFTCLDPSAGWQVGTGALHATLALADGLHPEFRCQLVERRHHLLVP